MASRRNSRSNPRLGRPDAAGSGALRGPGVSKSAPGSSSDEAFSPADVPRSYWVAGTLITLALFAWIFGPTIAGLVRIWGAEQDYSHGFLVAPFAALLLWLRRDTLPAISGVPGWGGVALLVTAFVVRYVGERLFLNPLAGWAMVLWIGGTCWLLMGLRRALWALPGLVFLLFMVPLPFRIEQSMSWHLQTVTTRLSSAALQCLGQPAISEGHTIYLSGHVLEVEQACSGLRMFVGIAAVAFAFVVLNPRPWWEKLILIVAVGPVAMLANSIRVVLTGLLMQWVSGDAAARFSHDAAGWATIVVAALLYGLFVAYLRRLIVPVEVGSGRPLLQKPAMASS